MPNSYNYTPSTANLGNTVSKYMVSRIINNPLERLLDLPIPTNIPEYFIIEVVFYSLYDNSIVTSMVIESTDEQVLTSVTLNYTSSNPSTQRRLLFINFSKFSDVLEQGRFKVVLNFLVPEIGTYNEGQFGVTRISPSRTEIEMELLPRCTTPQTLEQLRQFSAPQINTVWVDAALAQIFNQPTTAVVNSTNIPTDASPLTFSTIKESLPLTNQVVLENENTPEAFKSKVQQQTQIILNSAYGIARGKINQLKTAGTVRFTDLVLTNVVSSSIAEAMRTYTQVPGVILV